MLIAIFAIALAYQAVSAEASRTSITKRDGPVHILDSIYHVISYPYELLPLKCVISLMANEALGTREIALASSKSSGGSGASRNAKRSIRER
ncbi:hypothetical protein [Agrobacterium cavarae]|uniref:hypothetical protein n=1 Tax=Agrobacterium cavarae TaxID=2528239 RepID=UPI0028985EED|nr:hypothetical protein [Agrobacterium cavarae]